MESSDGQWFGCNTIAAIVFVVLCHLARNLYISYFTFPSIVNHPPATQITTSSRFSEVISDSELIKLVDELDNVRENDKWENVMDRGTSSLAYNAMICKPKDGPLKCLSVTVFENCSTVSLKDFYMDNELRMLWDKNVVEYEQLEVEESTGTEIGRIVKKFPLLTPREYILAWRLWEDMDGTFYCLSKNCEHPLAPRRRKYVRVESFISGWRIQKVPDRNACEIKMLHQEDAGMNSGMAKLAFSKGIWGFMCKMDAALRRYSPCNRLKSGTGATTLVQKAPAELGKGRAPTSCSDSEVGGKAASRRQTKLLLRSRWLVWGSILGFSHAPTSLALKLVMSYISKKRTNARLTGL